MLLAPFEGTVQHKSGGHQDTELGEEAEAAHREVSETCLGGCCFKWFMKILLILNCLLLSGTDSSGVFDICYFHSEWKCHQWNKVSLLIWTIRVQAKDQVLFWFKHTPTQGTSTSHSLLHLQTGTWMVSDFSYSVKEEKGLSHRGDSWTEKEGGEIVSSLVPACPPPYLALGWYHLNVNPDLSLIPKFCYTLQFLHIRTLRLFPHWLCTNISTGKNSKHFSGSD